MVTGPSMLRRGAASRCCACAACLGGDRRLPHQKMRFDSALACYEHVIAMPLPFRYRGTIYRKIRDIVLDDTAKIRTDSLRRQYSRWWNAHKPAPLDRCAAGSIRWSGWANGRRSTISCSAQLPPLMTPLRPPSSRSSRRAIRPVSCAHHCLPFPHRPHRDRLPPVCHCRAHARGGTQT